MLTNNPTGHCIANIARALHHIQLFFQNMMKADYTTGQFRTCQSFLRCFVLSGAELYQSTKTVKHDSILLWSGNGACCDFLRGKYSSALLSLHCADKSRRTVKDFWCCFLAGCAHRFMTNFWSKLNPAREVNNWTCQVITMSKSNCTLFLQRGILNQWAILLDSCSCNKNMC